VGRRFYVGDLVPNPPHSPDVPSRRSVRLCFDNTVYKGSAHGP